ncbi:MAG: DUF4924 family protein [Flavobacteriales bacterium]
MRPNTALKESNIAEYLLYIFQIEAMVRSLSLDIDLIEKQLLLPASKSPEEFQLHQQWYASLLAEFNRRGLQKEGHIEEVEEVLMELVYLHNTLLTIVNDEKYKALCEQAQPDLIEFKKRSNMAQRQDVEALLHAMFMKLQLKMKQQEISPETEAAFDLFRIQLAYLSRAYQQMKTGALNFFQN